MLTTTSNAKVLLSITSSLIISNFTVGQLFLVSNFYELEELVFVFVDIYIYFFFGSKIVYSVLCKKYHDRTRYICALD